MLHLSACLFKSPHSQKAQTATIGELSQAWTGSAHHPSADSFEASYWICAMCIFPCIELFDT